MRDLDYNPNKLYLIATGGDDCYVKFWYVLYPLLTREGLTPSCPIRDTRKSQEPLKVVKGHSHWVWNVEYNRFRDQLVLSSSTDSSVNLWKIATLSSDPLGFDDFQQGDDQSSPSKTYVPSHICSPCVGMC